MCNTNNETCTSIMEIINVLQQNACRGDSCLDTCDRKFLGCGANTLNCNTRPITIYLCNGTALSMPTTKDNTDDTTSNVFRVEKVDKGSATLRVLAPAAEGATYPYVSTNSFFTINTNCICCLKCLSDTYVEGI